MATDRKNIIRFTLENMIKQCGFKVKTGKNNSIDQFKELLFILQRKSLINILSDDDNICSPLIEYVKPKDLIICTLTIDFTNKYIELEDDEKEKIHNQEIDKVDNLKLLLYYCYLKCRIYKRPKDDQLVVSGGRAEVAYPSFEQINKDLGITDDTINKYNKILVDLNMIRISSAGNWYYKDDPNKILRESVNFYTLFTNEETATNNLKEGIKFWKKMDRNSNRIFTGNKNYKNNNKVLNGELGSIIKKEKLGTATEKDIARKNEILYSIKANDKQYGIHALLEANPGELLSDIYYSFNSDEKAEKYYELEKELGVINENNELLVEHEYYKWVMMNYNKDEHQYYVNCIDKHKNLKSIKHIGKPKPELFIIENDSEPDWDDVDDEEDTSMIDINALLDEM
jgi:hypothetical protein